MDENIHVFARIGGSLIIQNYHKTWNEIVISNNYKTKISHDDIKEEMDLIWCK